MTSPAQQPFFSKAMGLRASHEARRRQVGPAVPVRKIAHHLAAGQEELVISKTLHFRAAAPCDGPAFADYGRVMRYESANALTCSVGACHGRRTHQRRGALLNLYSIISSVEVGFTQTTMKKPTKDMSGWRMRVALALVPPSLSRVR